ncbi:unnamed protein product [Ascophyllum nodosum]
MKLGADSTVNVRGLSPVEAAERVVSAGGKRSDACVDCRGFDSSVATALAGAKSGGRVCLVGMRNQRAAAAHHAPLHHGGRLQPRHDKQGLRDVGPRWKRNQSDVRPRSRRRRGIVCLFGNRALTRCNK